MKQVCCHDCNVKIGNDEIAFNLKLLGKYIGNFYCNRCMSEKMGIEYDGLMKMISTLKTSGCIMFQKSYIE